MRPGTSSLSRSITERILESMSLCFLVRVALLALKKVELLWRKVVSAIAFSMGFKDTWASQVKANANLVAAHQNSPFSFAEGMSPQDLPENAYQHTHQRQLYGVVFGSSNRALHCQCLYLGNWKRSPFCLHREPGKLDQRSLEVWVVLKRPSSSSRLRLTSNTLSKTRLAGQLWIELLELTRRVKTSVLSF